MIRIVIIFFLFVMSAGASFGKEECAPLMPRAEDTFESFAGIVEGEIKGIAAKIAGGSGSIEGEYEKIRTDTLGNYPEADKIQVWQAILYYACVIPNSNIDIGELFRLYIVGPPRESEETSSEDNLRRAHDLIFKASRACTGKDFDSTDELLHEFRLLQDYEFGFASDQEYLPRNLINRAEELHKECGQYSGKSQLELAFDIGVGAYVDWHLPPFRASFAIELDRMDCGRLSNSSASLIECYVDRNTSSHYMKLKRIRIEDQNGSYLLNGGECGGYQEIDPATRKYKVALCLNTQTRRIGCRMIPANQQFGQRDLFKCLMG